MSNPHALIIDDNRMNIEVLTILLAKEQITFSAIESPRFLARTLDQIGKVDVVFLDLEIPNYDGYKVLTVLKSDARLSAVPIVAYTVHTGAINEARKAGFHSFIGKPLDSQRFPGQINRILNNQPVWEI
jgi:CheY-like chemotaxis protein